MSVPEGWKDLGCWHDDPGDPALDSKLPGLNGVASSAYFFEMAKQLKSQYLGLQGAVGDGTGQAWVGSGDYRKHGKSDCYNEGVFGGTNVNHVYQNLAAVDPPPTLGPWTGDPPGSKIDLPTDIVGVWHTGDEELTITWTGIKETSKGEVVWNYLPVSRAGDTITLHQTPSDLLAKLIINKDDSLTLWRGPDAPRKATFFKGSAPPDNKPSDGKGGVPAWPVFALIAAGIGVVMVYDN